MQNNLRPCTVLVLILLSSFSSWSQSNETSAYVITTANDTIRGVVKKQKLNNMLDKLFFKPANEASYKTYSTSEIKAFALEEKLYFEAATVTLTDTPQHAFMKALVNGPVKLYYTDNLSSAGSYYVQKPKETVVQLRKNSLKGAIDYLFSDCAGSAKTGALKYTSESLANVVDAYNKCRYPGAAGEVLLQKTKLQWEAGLRAGIHVSAINYSGRMYSENVPRKQNIYGLGTIGGFFLTVSDPNVSFAPQVELFLLKYSGSEQVSGKGSQLHNYTYSSQIDISMIHAPFLLRYNKALKTGWLAYLIAGPSFSYMLKSDFYNSITYQDGSQSVKIDRNEEVEDSVFGIAAGAGIEYGLWKKNRFIVDLRYSKNKATSYYSTQYSSYSRNVNLSSVILTTGITF